MNGNKLDISKVLLQTIAKGTASQKTSLDVFFPNCPTEITTDVTDYQTVIATIT